MYSKISLIRCTLVALLTSLASGAFAATYYVATTGSNTAGIYALSAGGQGPGYSHDSTHNFDSGGNGNSVTVTNDGAITGTQAGNVGIYALSVGGSAGATDSQYSLDGGDAGTVNVTLNGSIGYQALAADALDDAALRAVQAWRCTPPTRHGLPARGVAMQPFNFSLGR